MCVRYKVNSVKFFIYLILLRFTNSIKFHLAVFSFFLTTSDLLDIYNLNPNSSYSVPIITIQAPTKNLKQNVSALD